jgi:putative ABC transport system permease protein
MMRSLSALAWRNLQQHRLRTLFSATGVALGVAMVLAADVTGDAIRNAGQAIAESRGTVAFAGDFLNGALSIMGLVVLVAAGFLIFNAFGMAVTQRQRQIGALRSLGLTRRQVMRLILAEAALTGGVGTLLGLALGPLLGRGLVVLLAELVGVAHGPSSVRGVSLARGIVLGMGITLLATFLPARRATHIAPLVALRAQEAPGAEPQRRRAALGLALAALLLFYLVVNPPAAHVLAPPWDIVLTGLFALGWLFGLGVALPFLISGVSATARRIGAHRGAIGRLAADNLGRARRRVILTIVTLTVGLMMIVSVTGMTTFSFDVIVNYAVRYFDLDWVIGPLPQSAEGSVVGWEVLSKWDSSTMLLTPEFMAELDKVTAGRANLVHGRPLFLPELAILSGLPSYVVDPVELRRTGLFTFAEGDWETAQPIMESGCGLLLTPRMARSQDVWLYDTLTLPGVEGPVSCTVAGLGTSSFLGSTIVSLAGAADLGLDQNQVFIAIVQPLPEVDKQRLRADLDALLSRYPDNSLFEVDGFFQDVSAMVDSLKVMLNGMLLLAILAAALGVINTTMISVTERRTELGLLRAVGATRRQVGAVVAGEAAFMGLIGGLLGLVAGLGLTVIYIVTNGGNLYGLSDLPLWSSAWKSIQPAILSGLIGVVAAPLICAGAAWLAARPLLRGAAIETLHPERAGLRAFGRLRWSKKGFKRG